MDGFMRPPEEGSNEKADRSEAGASSMDGFMRPPEEGVEEELPSVSGAGGISGRGGQRTQASSATDV